MTLSELLLPELVLIKQNCVSKDGLISVLLDRIYATDRKPPVPREEALRKIKMREEVGGTLLPSGLSVPHVRLADFEGFNLALGIPAGPVFDEEGRRVRLMALMISNQTGSLWYLPVLKALTILSRETGYFSRLCAAENYEDFTKILLEKNPELA